MLSWYTNIPRYMRVAVNLIKVEPRKPINDPIEAFNATGEAVLLKTVSPIKAPANAPNRKPKGIGLIIPTTKPIVVPHAPALLPPNFLVP